MVNENPFNLMSGLIPWTRKNIYNLENALPSRVFVRYDCALDMFQGMVGPSYGALTGDNKLPAFVNGSIELSEHDKKVVQLACASSVK